MRWGVLGVAKIATAKVIPAMQQGSWCDVAAIASRDGDKARAAAADLGVPRAYGSYDELLADPDIEAVYNPLPNHLHVPWSIRALDAGKHVLCEKPIGLSVAEAVELKAARDGTGRIVQEAFMVRTHPQWLRAHALVRGGRIGALRSIAGYFSYFNRDPANIRNMQDIGGGALMDIGCYLIHTSRLIFEAEPRRVIALIDRDPDMKIDRLTSIVMDFDRGHAIGTCSTQVAAYQRMHLIGTAGRIETVGGNFFEQLPGHHDVHLLSMILHDWDEAKNRALLRRSFEALPSGGAVVISELLVNDEKTGPAPAALMSLNMLIETEGRNYTPAEYSAWLEEAGFRHVETVWFDAPAANGAVIGHKP